MSKVCRITKELKDHIAYNFSNTELGLVRIAKNLDLKNMTNIEVVKFCRKIILDTPIQGIEIKGKNILYVF